MERIHSISLNEATVMQNTTFDSSCENVTVIIIMLTVMLTVSSWQRRFYEIKTTKME